MTDPDYTAMAILMDRSGSMSVIASDAEGALQAFIDDQRKLPGKCTVRLSDFDDEYRVVYPSTPIADVPPYHLKPRYNTALLDGIGRLTTEFGAELAAMPEDARPGKVLVIVQTDGYENASREWTREAVATLIQEQESRYGWNFVFLGANQDAVMAGTGMGFRGAASMTYTASATGVQNTANALSRMAKTYRGAGPAGGQSVSFTDEERADAATR